MSEIDNLQEADKTKKNSTQIHQESEAIKSAAEIEDIEKMPSETLDTSENVEEAVTTDANNTTEKSVAEFGITETEEHDKVLNEIDDSNAEDSEDEGSKDRHTIEHKEYDNMSLEELTSEFEKLVKNEKIQAIKSHVESIKKEFDSQFNDVLEEKK